MALSASELEPLLRLAMVEGVGPHRLALLIDRFGSAERVLSASSGMLRSIPRMGAGLAERIAAADSDPARAATARAIGILNRMGAVAITVEDPSYPSTFLDVPDRPYILYACGDLRLLRAPSVAVVGTRTPTPYGRNAAHRLGRDLAIGGFAVVSGLARGIDSAAHEGALEADGHTIAVLGHGIEQVYPPEARQLYRRIRDRGLILTEYPPGETPRPGNFPRRNRLITALSQAVLVVEMGHRSGAQHTVAYALEQGKEVMAVPGPIGFPASEGTNQLIKDGARVVTCAADVIEELFGVGRERAVGGLMQSPDPATSQTAQLPPPPATLALVTPSEQAILNTLGSGALTIDEIATGAGISSAEVAVILLDLEIRGAIQSAPGMRYARRIP